MNDTQLNTEIKLLEVSKLSIAEYADGNGNLSTYQRNSKEKQIRSIADNYDSDIVGIILVSRRNGNYYIIDGQHRIEALKRIGKKTVLCQVLTGLSYEQEAEKFERLNTSRTPLTAVNKFNAKIEAKNDIAIGIANSLARYGFTYPRQKTVSADNTITAIGRIQTIYNRNGKQHFEHILKLLRACWNGEKASLQTSIITGLSNFLYNHSKEMDDKVFVAAMSPITPGEILLQATFYQKSPIRAIRDERNAGCVTKVMEEIYNGYAKKNKFDILSNDYS